MCPNLAYQFWAAVLRRALCQGKLHSHVRFLIVRRRTPCTYFVTAMLALWHAAVVACRLASGPSLVGRSGSGRFVTLRP